MSATTDAVLFDLFGVIAHHQPPAARHTLTAVAGTSAPEFWDAYWRHRTSYDRAEITATGYWHRVAADLGTAFDQQRVTALTAADITSWSAIDHDMVALIEQTAETGKRIALLSNIPEDLATHYEGRHGSWLRHFEVVAFSCRIGLGKPDAAAYQWCCQSLGLTPDDILFIDDRAENVHAAAALGMRTHQFTTPGKAALAIAATPASAAPPQSDC